MTNGSGKITPQVSNEAEAGSSCNYILADSTIAWLRKNGRTTTPSIRDFPQLLLSLSLDHLPPFSKLHVLSDFITSLLKKLKLFLSLPSTLRFRRSRCPFQLNYLGFRNCNSHTSLLSTLCCVPPRQCASRQ